MCHMPQEGLVGNRVIPALGLWNVVRAMERAFPVLMSPGMDAVTSSAGASAQGLEELWIQQASAHAWPGVGHDHAALHGTGGRQPV
jgi:hypothetical protein